MLSQHPFLFLLVKAAHDITRGKRLADGIQVMTVIDDKESEL